MPRTGGAVMAINHTSYLDFTYAGLPAWPVTVLEVVSPDDEDEDG